MENILFRADSSSTIGTGHIMRDLVLADQFIDSNIIFATQGLPGHINHKIKEKNFNLEILQSNDIKEILELVHKYSIDIIIIDNYAIDYNFEKELKEKTGIKIFVLDDTYEKHYCDILLNHNIYADETRYKNLVPKSCELRCGAEYTLLRREFVHEKKNRKPSSSTPFKIILIAMGGADHSNKNINILKVLNCFNNVHINVVTTTANQYLVDLVRYTQDKKHITLHINTNHIARLMRLADLAIITPSVILNEVYYLGLPFIAIQTAENQHEMYNYLVNTNYTVLDKFDAVTLKDKIKKFLNSQGVELLNFVDLSLDEKKTILEWRNNPQINQWMLTQDTIELGDHLKYIEALKARKDRCYFLVKRFGQAIGVIDFTNIDHKQNSAELGVYAKPGLKGEGTFLMDIVIDYAFRVLMIRTLISEVFADNKPAVKLYNRYNFKIMKKKQINNRDLISMALTNEDR